MVDVVAATTLGPKRRLDGVREDIHAPEEAFPYIVAKLHLCRHLRSSYCRTQTSPPGRSNREPCALTARLRRSRGPPHSASPTSSPPKPTDRFARLPQSLQPAVEKYQRRPRSRIKSHDLSAHSLQLILIKVAGPERFYFASFNALFGIAPMSAHVRRLTRLLRQAGIACGAALSLGPAQAQGVDCYDRALSLPAAITAAMADSCHSKVSSENTTNDRHAIALYNAARFYVALGDRETDHTKKAEAYQRAVADLLESRERASDDNVAFRQPWRKGDKRSQNAQMEANRYLVANRSYLLASAYFELAKLSGHGACQSRDSCFEMAAAELEKDVGRGAGAFHDTYVFLRARIYVDWGQSAPARRDLEVLRNSPVHGAAASRMLGQMFLADAQRQLAPPLTISGILAARVAYKAALPIPTAALPAQLGVADSFLLEAQRVEKAAEQLARYTDAAREFTLAVTMTTQQGSAVEQRRAHEGRGVAQMEMAKLGDAQALALAITDLETAARLDTTSGGAPAQLMLARALADAGRTAESDAAYSEAARRFGSDLRASLARSEQAFARGKAFFAGNDYASARAQFDHALAEADWRQGRADAYYFLSAIDLRIGGNAIFNADAAVAAGGGASQYRAQACLARVAAGGSAVKQKTAMTACTGDDFLLGVFYLRHAQLAPSAGSANTSRRLAQEAFTRARISAGLLRLSPSAEPLQVSELAAFGSAVALGCSSTPGLNVPVELSAGQVAAARSFFELHRVHSCVATN